MAAKTGEVQPRDAQIIDLVPQRSPGEIQGPAQWAARIGRAFQRSADAFLETGKLLLDAKRELPRGTFEAMVREQLPFKIRTAERLMDIARNPPLANPSNSTLLPPAWNTLHALAKLPAPHLQVAFERRLVHPALERKDVAEVSRRVRKALGYRVPPKSLPVSRRPFLQVVAALLSKDCSAALAQLTDRQRLDLAQHIAHAIETAVAPLIEGEPTDG